MEPLGGYPVRLAVHPKHRFARLRTVSLRAVADEPLLTYTRDEHPEAHAGLLKILAPYTSSPTIVGEYDSFTSLITAIEARRGIALVFHTFSLVAKGRLVLRPLKPSPPLLPVAMLQRPDGMSAAATAFASAVRSATSSSPRSGGFVFDCVIDRVSACASHVMCLAPAARSQSNGRMGLHDDDARKRSFGLDARTYDAMRPRYPDALIERVVAYARLSSASRALEIGSGTGIATLPFAKHGCSIHCLELSEAMADVARTNL